MIGYLSGTVKFTNSSTLIVCNGVGYAVMLTYVNRERLREGEQAEVFIFPYIKEDAFDLYGFLRESEKSLFLKLIDVDGVGPKTAMNILDRGEADIIRAVQSADVSFFSSISRVGKKSAQKIIIELKNKLGGTQELDLQEPTGKAKEVIEALVSLGFSETQSQKVTKSLELGDMRVEDAIKKGIQELTKRSVI